MGVTSERRCAPRPRAVSEWAGDEAAGWGPPDPHDSSSLSGKLRGPGEWQALPSLPRPKELPGAPGPEARAGRGTGEAEAAALETGLHGLGASRKMNVGNLFQDVNVSELMKKLDILGDNGVTMPVGFCSRALVSTWVCSVCLSFPLGLVSS